MANTNLHEQETKVNEGLKKEGLDIRISNLSQTPKGKYNFDLSRAITPAEHGAVQRVLKNYLP